MSAPTFSRSGDQKSFIDGLVAVASRLVHLMERETAILREMRPGDIGSMQEEKLRLIRGYESMVNELREDPSRIAAVSEAVRQELRETVIRFEEAAATNARALTAAQEANERLLKAIVDAAAAQTAHNPTYVADGGLRKAPRADAKGISMALDQKF